MAGILPRGHTRPWLYSAAQCSALLHVSLQFFPPPAAAGSRDQMSGRSCGHPDVPSLGSSGVQCRRHTFFWQPIRLSLVSAWRESIVQSTCRQETVANGVSVALFFDGWCVGDDEMCLRKRSARAGWDLSAAVRPEAEGPRATGACHCHSVPLQGRHSPNSGFRSRTVNPPPLCRLSSGSQEFFRQTSTSAFLHPQRAMGRQDWAIYTCRCMRDGNG